MKPISSAITPLLKDASQQTGTPPSEHGSETRSSGALSVQPARLLERSPADNLAAAVSSLQEYGLSVKHEATGSRFVTKMSGDVETTTWEPVMTLTVSSSGSLAHEPVRLILDALQAPAPTDKITEWLTICAGLTLATRDDDPAGNVRLKAYTAKLAEFPGDVVRKVLSDWPSKSKWFPAWAELQVQIHNEMSVRLSLIHQARRHLNRSTTGD